MKPSMVTAATPRAAPGLMARVLTIAMMTDRDSFETVLELSNLRLRPTPKHLQRPASAPRGAPPVDSVKERGSCGLP